MPHLVLVILLLLLAGCGSLREQRSLSLGDALPVVESRWATSVGDLVGKPQQSFIPQIAADRVYFATPEGQLSARTLTSGELQWQLDLNEGLSAGPGVGGGMVLVGSQNAELIAVSETAGKPLWRAATCSEMLAAPVVNGGKVFVQCIDGQLEALDAATGKALWHYHRTPPALTLRGSSMPLVEGQHVIAGFADGKLVAVNSDTGEPQWEATIAVPRGRTDLERMVDIDGPLSSAAGAVFVTSFQGRIAAVSLDNGRVLWAREMSSYTGTALGPGEVLVSDVDGKLWALDRNTGATLWRQEGFANKVLTTPLSTNGVVLEADSQGNLYWLGSADGKILARQNMADLWRQFYPDWRDEENEQDPPKHSISVLPIGSGDMVLVRDDTGALLALQIHNAVNTQ